MTTGIEPGFCAVGHLYRGWAIDFEYGWYTAVGPNYEAEPDGEGGWTSNDEHTSARTLKELQFEIDAILDDDETPS